LHYINRLRHIDFTRIFKQANFDIVDEIVHRPNDWEKIVNDFPFADEFTSKYTLDELSIISANIVLKPV